MMVYKKQAGLTLIELLIAMSVFSILAVLSYAGLATVLDASRAIKAESQQLAMLQRAWLRMGRDFEQAAPRMIRDGHGDQQPALHNRVDSYEGVQTIIELSLSARRVFVGERQSSLQRISYILRDGVLLRLRWPVLDRAQDSQPHESILLEGVNELSLRYLDKDNNWLRHWSEENSHANIESSLPRAIEVTMRLERWGQLRRIYRLAG